MSSHAWKVYKTLDLENLPLDLDKTRFVKEMEP